MSDNTITIQFNVKLKNVTTVFDEDMGPGVIGFRIVEFTKPKNMSDTQFAAAVLGHCDTVLDDMVEVEMVQVHK